MHGGIGKRHHRTFSNNHDLTKEIQSAAFTAGEKMWELPLEKEYKKMNKSDVADIAIFQIQDTAEQ